MARSLLCVDEKSQIQAQDRTQPLFPMQSGQLERGTHDYKRHGTTSLFASISTDCPARATFSESADDFVRTSAAR
jgi:hypothetical protein